MRFPERTVHRGCFAQTALASLLLVASLPFRAPAQSAGTGQTVSSSTVAGRVVNAVSGLPLPRVLVQIGPAATFTDHDGRFSFADVPAGTSFVEITKPGFYTSPEQTDPPAVPISTADPTHPVELRLYPEALLTGSVVAQDGQPLSLITVTARRMTANGSARSMQTVGSALTDTHGDFRLAVAAGDYQVTTQFVPVSPETGLSVLPAIAPASTASLHLNSGEGQQVQLRPATGVPHNVVLAVGGLAEDRSAIFTLTSASGASWQMPGQTDADSGHVTLRLPPGSYLLDATASGSDSVASGQTRLNVPDHDIAGVALQLSPVASIPVEIVLDAHATVPQAGVPSPQQLGLELVPDQGHGRLGRDEAVRVQSRAGRPTSFSPGAGQYHLVSASRNGWYIQSAVYGGAEILGSSLTVAAGTGSASLQVTVSNVTGTLQGQVTAGGVPLSAWVHLIPGFPSASPLISLRSSPDGTFSAPMLQPGVYAALALEHRTSADLLDPAVRGSLGVPVQTVTVQAGVTRTLDLDGSTGGRSAQ